MWASADAPIGINGLGRIGRLALRRLATAAPDRLGMVNDPADLTTLVHLLRYDSVHVHNHLHIEGHQQGEQDYLVIEGRAWPLHHEKEPERIPWAQAKVGRVIESSGRFTRRDQAAKHLGKSVTHVIISAPSADADCTLIQPVYAKSWEADAVVSNASCTAHATAPMLEVLHRSFGLTASSMSTVHVATNDQRLLDAPHPDLRRARAAMQGIHPTTSSAFQAMKSALPWVHRDFDGWALRVPTLSVNLVDLTVYLQKKVILEEVNEAYRQASSGDLKGILAIAEGPLVSCDFTGREESVVMDLALTRLVGGRFLKVCGWHDNETAYAARLCELALSD